MKSLMVGLYRFLGVLSAIAFAFLLIALFCMGIELTYRRLKKAKWARLQKDREKAKSFLFSLPGIDFDSLASFPSDPQANPAARAKLIAALRKAKKDPTRVELDKDWH